MKISIKKNILFILSILNTIMCCIYLGRDIVNDFYFKVILLDVFYIGLSLFPGICILKSKRFKHLYYLVPFYSLLAFLGVSISTYIFSIIGILTCFIESKEERGILVKVLKRHPVIMSLVIVFSCVSFLSIGSLFIFFSELLYGFNMLGELFATIFLFFIMFACRKEYLIVKNEGSLKEGLLVSLPFLIYSIYIGLGLLGMYFFSGYNFVSVENIIVIVLLYLLVGVFEDFLTRGLALNILLDKFSKTKRGIWLSIFLSSLFFGLVHLVNLFTGASLQGVLIQVISATCIGMYFSAIYLRSGSVWVPALLHGFYDVMVSVSSFFVIKEVVDITKEYGETISNYSWSNLIVGLIFILLTLFLLRRDKMDEVYSRINKVEKVSIKIKDKTFSYVLMGVGTGIGIFICFSTITSFFQLRSYAYSFYEKMPDSLIGYNIEDYDSLSDEVKLIISSSKILSKVEENKSEEEIVTYIDNYEIENNLKDIFNKKDVKYIDFIYSDRSSCSYESDLQRYKCITKYGEDNIRVYTNVDKVIFDGDSVIELYIYYLIEDVNTKTLYADKNMEIVYKNNTLIEDISNGVKYLDESNNKDFWKNIKENNNGLVPMYKIKLDLNTMGTGLYFVGSEFDYYSVLKDVEEIKINDNLFRYDTSDFSIELGKDFEIKEINDYVVINYKDDDVLRIEKISSDIWFNKYNSLNKIDISLGNYIYSNIMDEYLIYKDDFYIISINTSDIELKNKVLEIVSSIEFY